MNESVKNPSESIGELFLMAYGGLDPEPALTMIRDYRISGFYLSNDNVPDRKTAQDLSRILQEENKKNSFQHSKAMLKEIRRDPLRHLEAN